MSLISCRLTVIFPRKPRGVSVGYSLAYGFGVQTMSSTVDYRPVGELCTLHTSVTPDLSGKAESNPCRRLHIRMHLIVNSFRFANIRGTRR